MTEKWFAIVNQAAGGGRCARRAPKLLDRLAAKGFAIEYRLTESPGHATKLVAMAHSEGHRRFLLFGGDGTSFEALNALFPREASDDPVTFGFLPLGTGNSFIRDFGVRTEGEALSRFQHGTERAVDVIELQHAEGRLFFMNIFSLGFSAEVGALCNEKFKALGKPGYALAVLTKLGALRAGFCRFFRDDSSEGQGLTFLLLSVCNSKFTGGGMQMAPNASTDDGLMDVIGIAPLSAFALVKAFPRIFVGSHVRMKEVTFFQCSTLALQGMPLSKVMIDGEVCLLRPQRLQVHPKALRIRV